MPWEFIQYWWHILRSACAGAWGIAQLVAGMLAIAGGCMVRNHPQWESKMKNLLWMVPLVAFLLFLVGNLLYSPYKQYKQQTQIVRQLQDARDQKELDRKRKIRTLLESINPEIIQYIDAGYKEIEVFISIPKGLELTELSKRPDFSQFLLYKKGEDVNLGTNEVDGYILESGYGGLKEHFSLYPKDALIK
jgi:hypothetical protein